MSPAKTGSLFSPLFRFPVTDGQSDEPTETSVSQDSNSHDSQEWITPGEKVISNVCDDDDEVFITSAAPPQEVG